MFHLLVLFLDWLLLLLVSPFARKPDVIPIHDIFHFRIEGSTKYHKYNENGEASTKMNAVLYHMSVLWQSFGAGMLRSVRQTAPLSWLLTPSEMKKRLITSVSPDKKATMALLKFWNNSTICLSVAALEGPCAACANIK